MKREKASKTLPGVEVSFSSMLMAVPEITATRAW